LSQGRRVEENRQNDEQDEQGPDFNLAGRHFCLVADARLNP
jgi:hypothetical protein